MRRIVLHIDRLVLRGIERADAASVASSIQAELQRRLAIPGAVASFTEAGDAHRIKAGTVQVAHGSGGSAMGHAIAGGIIKGSRNDA